MNDSDFTIGFKQGQEHGKQIILEKIEDIRAEIEKSLYFECSDTSYDKGHNDATKRALEIIDKYKARTEKGVNNAQEL